MWKVDSANNSTEISLDQLKTEKWIKILKN